MSTTHLLQMSPLCLDVLDPLCDLGGSKVSLVNQSLSGSDAVTQRAVPSRHLVPERLMFAEQVKGGGEVTSTVSTGEDLLLLSDPGRLLTQIPHELPQPPRVLQAFPAVPGELTELVVGLTQQVDLLADQPGLARFVSCDHKNTESSMNIQSGHRERVTSRLNTHPVRTT